VPQEAFGSKEKNRRVIPNSQKMELIQLYSNHFIKITRKFYQGKSMKLRKGMDSYKWS
jgi:predicted nucleic acid-binding Zn finger protein